MLGVSGGIAAYKSAELVRLLTQKEIQVHCILTEHAEEFVTPLTLATLSGQPVLTGRFESPESGKIQHIELAETADLILVAPATANVIAKLAHGIADDLLTTTLLAAQGMVVVCPAMNVFMWENQATVDNLALLKKRGIQVIGPAPGALACGYEGMGRMEEPESIVAEVEAILSSSKRLSGKKVLITAGPTREFFDPVRCLSNPSTGRMGYALAETARQWGAQVVLVSGPTEISPPSFVDFIQVTTAEEMYKAVLEHFHDSDFFISAAAVSDWKPKEVNVEKLKKGETRWQVELEPTPDILALVSRQKTKQILVGFAAETNHLEENAKKKLHYKNLDLIVGNLVSTNGHNAFGSEDNEITLISRSGEAKPFPRISKQEAAYHILEAMSHLT